MHTITKLKLTIIALILPTTAASHELKGHVDVNVYGLAYKECVREGSKKSDDIGLVNQYCYCAFEQTALHDQEENPGQVVFLPMSKHIMHAAQICNEK